MNGSSQADRCSPESGSTLPCLDFPVGAFDQLRAVVAASYHAHCPPPSRVVVAVSGGADSVALLRLLHALHKSTEPLAGPADWLVAAHFNHALRGEESEQDQTFVEQLAQSLGIPCVVGRAHNAASDRCSEETFRNQRYQFLEQVACQTGARYVALAHTADDQVETILHQLFRGTGPVGIAGMPQFRSLGEDVVLIRPLLQVRREELRDLLRALDQPWRHDSSNDSSAYRRNWLRNELLPLVRAKYQAVDDAILRCATGQSEFLGDARAAASRLAARMFAFEGCSQLRIQLPDRLFDPWLAAGSPLFPDAPLTAEPIAASIAADADGQLAEWAGVARSCPRSLLVLALNDAWDRNGWSRQNMASKHWGELVCLILEGNNLGVRVINLPGDLRAECSEVGTVVVRRQSE